MDSLISNERNTLDDIFMNSGGKYKDSIDTLVKTGYGGKPVEIEEKECDEKYPGVHQTQQQDKCGKHALMALTSTPETEDIDEEILDQAITCTAAGSANHMESDALVATTKRIGFDWYTLKKSHKYREESQNALHTITALLEMMRIPGDDVMGFIVHTASHWVAVRRFTVPGHHRFCWYLVVDHLIVQLYCWGLDTFII